MSPEIQAFTNAILIALGHAGLTLALLVTGAVLYALMTPHKEISLIRDGNAAAAVSFGGVLVALALLRAAAARGVPGVAAPSANRFGRLSPTCAAHVVAELGDEPGLRVLDGGGCPVGIESTIIDCSRAHPVLLRPGTLTRQTIEAVLGEPLLARDADAPRASGTLDTHYAPRARVRLLGHDQLQAELEQFTAAHSGEMPAMPPTLAVYSRQPLPAQAAAIHQTMPPGAAAVAHELFSVLRSFDDRGAQQIWVELPPADAEWDGVRDRLARASA